MEKVCFDDNNNLIGFNLQDSTNFINLFNININKTIMEFKNINAKDSLGRQLYKIIDKNTNKEIISNQIINNEEFEIEKYKIPSEKKKVISLLNNIGDFTIDDIMLEKSRQLKEKYKCNDCIAYELLNDNIKFNTDMGKNVIKIYANKEISSNQIKLNDPNQIAIYYESDNDLQIEISANNRNWKSINKEEYIDFNNRNLYIKFLSSKDSNIYSVAILIR